MTDSQGATHDPLAPLPAGAPEHPDPLVGRTVAKRYRVLDLLARGGMARVYRARDERLERDVALKVLSKPYADDEIFVARFLGEARAAASLSHPNLIHVYDSGSDGPLHFIVMELLDGYRSLREGLAEEGRLPPDSVLAIGRELLAGLGVVHAHGLVHCDVKSGNLMIGPGPTKLIDLGIARSPNEAREKGISIGSLHAMSPEQLAGEPLSAASDLYAVGVVLYEALTGRVPYPGATPDEVAAAQRGGDPPRPSSLAADVPRRLDEAILQALRFAPTQRFASAEAMGLALAAARPADGDATQVVDLPAAVAEPGYVPPLVHRGGPLRSAVGATTTPRRAPAWGSWAIALAALLMVAAIVVAVLLVGRPGGSGGGAAATATPSGTAETSSPLPSGMVRVPNTVGLTKDAAIAAANAAGLQWRIECLQDAARPVGIYDQEPRAGQPVQAGSRFTMYSARIADCR